MDAIDQIKLFSDFSKTTPAAAISPEPRKGYWRVCAYTSGEIEGKLLYTDAQGETPTLTLPLNLRGWHRVTIGVWGHLFDYPGTHGNRVKLSGDRCFKSLQRDGLPPADSISIEDIQLTCADLSGQDLLIAPPARGSSAATALAYVRCEALSSPQVEELQADRRNGDFRKTIAYNDGVSFVASRQYRDKEDLWELVEWYRYSDMESLCWGMVGTVTAFPVKAGRMMTGYDAEAFEALNKKGINSLTTAMEYAQEMGLKFFVYQRMGRWADPFPGEYCTNDLCTEHPEWRCINREGIRTPHLSYAFPEVRRHQIELLAEIASWGVDGIDLNFLRGPVYVLYEQVLVEGFAKEYGEDPRELDEWDERWLRYRCRSLTAFVRELRTELDAVGKERGKHIALLATTFATELANLFYGLDLETWVREGLVERLIPWGNIRGMPPIGMDYYRGLVAGSRTELWPHLRGRGDVADMCREALGLYESGAAGLAAWDNHNFDGKSVKGPFLRRLGHIDELRARLADKARQEPLIRRIDTLGTEDLRVACIPETHPERIMPEGYDKHHFMWHG